jgi:esterase/lipase
MTLSDWMQDVTQLYAWLKSQSPDAPVIFNGLGFGALFAARLFHEGAGDGLILWSPPSDANTLLRSTLANWATLQKFGKLAEEQKSFAHYVQQFEKEGSLEVNGYVWSAKLWRESFGFTLPTCMTDAARASEACHRPVSITILAKDASPLLKEGVPGYEEAKDFEWLFSTNFDWITSTLAVHQS